MDTRDKRKHIYLDIDGVLVTKNQRAANGLEEFLIAALNHGKVSWLTTHCKGSSEICINYLEGKISPTALALAKLIQPTDWRTFKTEAINFYEDFLWFDDQPMETEVDALEKFVLIDLYEDPYQLLKIANSFKS